MDTTDIRYRIELGDRSVAVVDLSLDQDNVTTLGGETGAHPAWTQLEYCQCPHCPLSVADHPCCPVAIRLAEIVERFDNVVSYDEVKIEVLTSDRVVIRTTTAQKAVSSIFGLLIATSDCPHTQFLKPMARFHLPCATQDETIYRVTSMYLLAQYFIAREGRRPDHDFEGLNLLYANLHEVNVKMAARLKLLTTEDSSVNAIVVLDVFANMLPIAIEDELVRIEKLFEPYLSDFHLETMSGDKKS